MTPFDRWHYKSSYSSSIVTMAVRILYRFRTKARYNWSKIPLVFNLHDPREPRRIFAQNFNTICPSPCAIRRYKNITEKFKSLATVQQRYRRQTNRRQTDRQTDRRQTDRQTDRRQTDRQTLLCTVLVVSTKATKQLEIENCHLLQST